MDLKLRSLKVFQLFASTKNVTETARLMHISQPAVSLTLHELERETGFSLVRRVGRRLELTDEAWAILPHVDRVMAEMTALRGRIAEVADVESNTLSVASIPALSLSIVPQAVFKLRLLEPQARLRIGSYTAVDIVNQIRAEKSDIGLVFLPVDETGLRVEPLLRTAIICLVPENHRLSRERVVNAASLREELVLSQHTKTRPGYIIKEYFHEPASDQGELVETNQSILAVHLMLHGVGVAVTHPLILTNEFLKGVVGIRLEPQVELTLALLYPKERTPGPHEVRFTEILRSELGSFAKVMTAQGIYCKML